MLKYIFLILLFFCAINLYADESISGSISGVNRFELAKSPYLINSDLIIESNAELIIEPRVIIKFAKNANIIVKGRLLASGSNDSLIYFTSQSINYNWGSIIFENTDLADSSIVKFCKFERAGSSGAAPIKLDPRANPKIAELSFSACSYNGIQVLSGSYSENIYLNITDVSYIAFKDIEIQKNKTLNISPAVIIKFDKNANLVIKGVLNAFGSIDQRIVLTSLNDDSSGGDANSNGFSKAVPLDWGGIVLTDALAEANLKFVSIKYGSGSILSNNSLIFVELGSLKIEYSLFAYSGYYGIRIAKSGEANIGDNSDFPFGANCFLGFSKNKYAVYNESSKNINAQNNYWNFSDSAAIESVIYDKKDNSFKGLINFSPFIENYPNTAPSKPIIIYPANNQTNIDNQTNFEISAQNTDFFRFQIAYDSNFKNLLCDTISNSPTISFSELVNSKNYYFRAKALNLFSSGVWSENIKFSTTDRFVLKDISIKDSNHFIYKFVDFTGDGIHDLLIGSKSGVKILKNSNGVYVQYFESNALDSGAIICDDFNNDSKLDFVILGYFNNQWISQIYYNNGSSFSYSELFVPPITDFSVKSADINSDGLKDIIIYGYALNKYSAFQLINIDSDFNFYELNIDIDKEFVICDINKDSYLDFISLGEESKIMIKDKNNYTKFNINLPNFEKSESIIENFYEGSNQLISLGFINKSWSLYKTSFDGTISESALLKTFTANNSSLVCGDFLNYGTLQIAIAVDTVIEIYSLSSSGLNFEYSIKAPYIKNLFSLIADNSYNTSLAYIDKFDNLIIIQNKEFKKNKFPEKPSKLITKTRSSAVDFSWKDGIDAESSNLDLKYIITIQDAFTKKTIYKNQTLNGNIVSNNSYESLISKSNYSIPFLPDGSYLWFVNSIDNSLKASQNSDSGYFKFGGNRLSPPLTWDYLFQSDYNSLVIIPDTASIFFNNRKISAGDAIGAFFKRNDSLICAGYGIAEDGLATVIPIWSDNSKTQIKDGFAFNEQIRFKIWDAQLGKEFYVKPEIQFGSSKFINDEIVFVKNMIELDKQIIKIDSLKSNYCSFYYELPINSPNSIIEKYSNSSIIIEALNGDFYSNTTGGNLSKLNSLEGYKIYSDNKIEIAIEGYEYDYDVLFKADALKTFFLPNIKNKKLNIKNALDGVYDELIYICDEEGALFYPKYNIYHFDSLDIGKAYKCVFKSEVEFHLSNYEQNNSIVAEKMQPIKFKFVPPLSGSNSIIIFENSNLNNGDEIIALNSLNEIIGVGVAKNGKSIFSIWGKNRFFSSIGANNEENLKLHVWSSKLNVVRNISIRNVIDELTNANYEQDLKYQNDKVFRINGAIGDIVKVEDIESNNFYFFNSTESIYCIYPNTKIIIYNILGEIVFEKNIETYSQINLKEFLNNGLYFIRLISPTKSKLDKIIIEK